VARQLGPNLWEFDSPAGPLRGQGATVEDAKLNALNTYHHAATPPPDAKGKPGKVPDFVGRAKAALVGEMSPEARGASMQGDVRDPSSTVAALKGVGDVVLPGSLEQLAVQAATLGAPGVVRAVGATGQVAKTAIGVGVPAVAGAAAGAAKGESPVPGAVLGATVGTIGEITRLAFQGTGALLEKITRKWGNLETKAFNERVRAQVGPTIAKDIAADIPSLREAGISLNNVPDMLKLLDDSTGRQVVGKMFDRVEGEVARKVRSVQIPRDIAVAAGRQDLVQAADAVATKSYNDQARMVAKQLGIPANDSRVVQVLEQAGIKPLATVTVEASGSDAIAIAKQLRHQGLRKGEGIQGRPPRAMAEDIQQRLDRALGNDPLKGQYAQLRDDYSKFMDLRDWMVKNDPSALFPGMVSKGGATIDLVHFGDRMVKDIADLPPSRFPHLHRTMTGAGSGTRAVEAERGFGMHVGTGIPGTHARVYPSTPRKSPPDVPASLSTVKVPPGKVRKAGEIAAGAARVGTAAAVPSLDE
jgi:hypothetical protein